MAISCLIVDDEKLARELLTAYVEKVPGLVLAGTCSNALEAQVFLQQNQVGLMFLDIHMPHLTGLEFLRSLRNPPTIILTTAYSEYAVEAFEYEVHDYLLKPVMFDRFFKSVARLLNVTPEEQPAQAPLPSNTETKPDFIFVKADQQIHKVNLSDIIYIESLREYTRIHTIDKRLVFRHSLANLAEQLPAASFFRIHRSYIINIGHIASIEGNRVCIGKEKLPVSKGQREAFKAFIEQNGLIG